MSFNPIQNYQQGFKLGEQQKTSSLRNQIASQIQQGGFDPSASLLMEELAALDPTAGARMLNTFQQLDHSRQEAFFKDARKGRQLLERGDFEGFRDLTTKRLNAVEKFKGDPTDVMSVMQSFNAGDINGTINQLKQAEMLGVQGKFLQPTEPRGKPKLGTYKPENYTVDSWSEFAKYGDPSILKRYESGSKERGMLIREQAMELKEEKFKLAQEKQKIESNRKEIKAAQEKKDIARAQYLEVKEAESSISNINTLLDSDLDLIYGSMEWALPDKIRSQRGKNMLAQRDQVSSTMSLMAAGKLKGQGTITENEREMLRRAASILGNSDISPGQAKQELLRIKPIFQFFKTGNRTDTGKSLSDEELLKKYGG